MRMRFKNNIVDKARSCALSDGRAKFLCVTCLLVGGNSVIDSSPIWFAINISTNFGLIALFHYMAAGKINSWTLIDCLFPYHSIPTPSNSSRLPPAASVLVDSSIPTTLTSN